ncbi:hypothetical protein D3C78_1673860 [compost metagenome]
MELDPGDDLFAVARAGNANHLHVRNGRMSEEKFFQLPRVNILTTTDDHVLVAPGNAHVALVVHARQVTGVHPPSLIDGVRRAFRVVPIAEHHAVTAGA